MNQKFNHKEFAVVSIFSGAGGLDQGLVEAGFPIDLAIEWEQVACDTYQVNHPNSVVWFRDIRTVTGEEIRKVVGNRKIILAGGSPCQSFSDFQNERVGSKKGLEDERGQLVFDYVRLVKELQPVCVVFENVENLVTQHIDSFNLFREHLLKISGLNVSYKVLNSLDFGVAQQRKRVFLVGVRKGLEDPLAKLKPIKGPKTLREALVNVPESEFATFDPKSEQIMKMIPEGKCWNALPTHMAMKALGKDYRAVCRSCNTTFKPQYQPNCPKCGSSDFKNGYGVTSYFRRLAWDKPSPTLCAVGVVKPHGAMGHPDFNRGLSIAESKRVMGFPDHYVLKGTLAQQYRQLGNAVTPGVARAIGFAIMEVLQNNNRFTQENRGIVNTGVKECLDKLIQHPLRAWLTSLEKDFLSSLYKRVMNGEPISDKHVMYLKETYMKLERISKFTA